MTQKPVSIVVADDHPLFRKGLAQTLSEHPGFVVAGEADNKDDAVKLVAALSPDVALIDLSMPGGGLAAIDAIVDLSLDTRIVVLTASEADDDVVASLRRGAHAYLLKGVDTGSLIDALNAVLRGQGYVPPQLATRVIANSRPEARDDLIATLTDRETAILREVGMGASNKEIARRLRIEEKTVKNHMTSILKKLNLRNRTEAALRSREIL